MRPSPIVTMDVLVGGLRPFKCASPTPGGRDRGAGTLRRRLLLRQPSFDQRLGRSARSSSRSSGGLQATYTWVELHDDLTVSLLQARLIELNLPISVEIGTRD